jgi:hypothetical protein
MDMNTDNKKKTVKMDNFQYKLKLRTAVYGFLLYLILTSPYAFKVLSYFFNDTSVIINNNNQPTFIAHLIMAFIIFIFLFIF